MRLFAGVVLLLFLLCVTACSRQPAYPEPARAGTDLVIDVTSLGENVPQFYTYNYSGCNVNFFVIKVRGRVLSFLDACMKCHSKKLGFRFADGSVVCKACDERYPVSEIETGFGSCYPVRIEGKNEGGRYLLPVAELEKMGEKFFR
jgi:uncharacterized membrane protein